jgi:nucleotide-binding universal stress UspA family protein
MFTTVIVGADNGAGDADATALATLLAEPGAEVAATHIEHGSVGHGLHDAAVAHGADLIVLGSSHCGVLGRIFAGDDVAATLRSAPCAVAVAPRGFAARRPTLARIGVGYDGSAQAQAAMEVAKALAAREGARVRALGVATPPQGLTTPIGVSAIAGLEAKREQIEQCIAQLGPGIDGEVLDGIAHQRLAELSAEVDLLVVGPSRHGGIGRVLLGNTSETLSREAACPLLVVTAPAASPPSPEPPDQPASAPAG